MQTQNGCESFAQHTPEEKGGGGKAGDTNRVNFVDKTKTSNTLITIKRSLDVKYVYNSPNVYVFAVVSRFPSAFELAYSFTFPSPFESDYILVNRGRGKSV